MSTNLKGYTGKIIKIDLATRTVTDYPFCDEDRAKYLGGKIMACKIISDHIKAPIDPLSAENLIVISTGPLAGAGCPCSSRFNISTISPITKIYTSSNCGGGFGLAMKRAGYDAVIITGKSEERIYLDIKENNQVEFLNADFLWGKTTEETQKALGKGSKLAIGAAGENFVNYACVMNDDRAAGRAGVGTVFGSKNIKAIKTQGILPTVVANKEKLQALNKEWTARLKSHPLTGDQLPKLGTAALVSKMQKRGLLATKNFQFGTYKDYDMISGETLREKYLIKNKGCMTCPIQCGRVVEVDGKQIKGPELETLGLLGSNILNNDLEKIFKWNFLLDEYGMDTMSFGMSLAFAMELKEKGMADLGVEFGKTDNIEELIRKTAFREGVGNEFANGVKWLSEKYGGKEFAMHSKGLELAAYEPRSAYGQGLGYAVSNRGGCHLNGGYGVVLEGLGIDIKPRTAVGKAGLVIMFQNLMEAVSAGGSCLFSTYAFFPQPIMRNRQAFISKAIDKVMHLAGGVVGIAMKAPKLLAVNLPHMLPHPLAINYVTGFKLNMGKLIDIGKRGYDLERKLDCLLGIDASKDTLPKRLTDDAQPEFGGKVPLAKMKRTYYKMRGWSKNGIPKK